MASSLSGVESGEGKLSSVVSFSGTSGINVEVDIVAVAVGGGLPPVAAMVTIPMISRSRLKSEINQFGMTFCGNFVQVRFTLSQHEMEEQ